MKKTVGRVISILIMSAITGWFLYPGLKGETARLLPGEKIVFSQNASSWDLPSPYAQTSWPTIHRDSRNSNYLPFTTTATLKQKWHAIENDYSAVVTPAVIGPEGNIYFTTGKDESYGNLHAFDRQGNELWRSYLLDVGALCSSPLIDHEGDLYLADADEFFSFHPDGSLKWRHSGLDGPFASTVFTLDGHIVGINRRGIIYVFDPKDGRLATPPLELPDQPPGDRYRLAAPSGLWQGMVSTGNNGLSTSEIFNCLMGYQFKVTNTPVVNPANGRIYILGNIKPSERSNTVQGKFYGIDFIPGSGDSPGGLRLAFQTRISPGSGASPAVSSDGSHIYVLDGAGTLFAFNKEGGKAWRLHIGIMPASPTVGSDGTIYCVSRSTLYAVKDSGNSGSTAWKMDFTDTALKRLPDSPPSWVEDITYRRDVKPTVRCNSVVSASKNYLYLTLSSGYELMPEKNEIPVFFTMESLLLVIAPPRTAENQQSEAVITSIIELPDTSEGIIALDKDGTVFCSHASIATSNAYYSSQKIGFEFRKPIGGITVLGPE
ncbi:MAG: PQQ-binding-like beta-propeller repeat protein [bacterium]